MKRLLLATAMLVVGLTMCLSNTQTNVSGFISTNTVWTLANSPYVVTGNILVGNGVTLTIEPGVTVEFDSALSIEIDGTLLARGTSYNNITFTSHTAYTAGAWGYIYFTATSTPAVFQNDSSGNYLSGSILEYCTIQYAGGTNVSDNGAIRLNNAHPFINYCTISDNSASGIRVYNLASSINITNSIIRNNVSSDDGGGIYFYNDPSALVGSSVISGNTISANRAASYGGGIWAQVCNYRILTISNNTISDNSANNGGGIYNGYHGTAFISHNIVLRNAATNGTGNVDAGGGGVYVDDYSTTTVSDNIIAANTSSSHGGGVFSFSQATATFARNVIADNKATLLGGGIYNWYTMPVMTNNQIFRNVATDDAGIYCSNGFTDTIAFNTLTANWNTGSNDTLNRCILLTSSDRAVIEHNNIFVNSVFYGLYDDNDQGTLTIDATRNWWGTSSDSKVQKTIYDWFDKNTLGLVSYSPYLTAPDTAAPVSPPAIVRKTNIGGGQTRISWNRNPESDIAGYRISYGGFSGYSFTHSIDVGNDTTYVLTGVPVSDTIAVTSYDGTYSLANELGYTIVNDNMTNGNESWYAYAVDTAPATGVAVQDGETPKAYALRQNYPNPFNPSTTIAFTLPFESHVSLKVYDVLGKEVATLVNEVRAAGSYTSQWNAAGCASGVYFYRLQAGSFADAKKLLLLR